MCSYKCLHQEKRKISNKQPKLTPHRTRKRTKPKVSKREKIKNRAEVNKIENGKIEKINKAKKKTYKARQHQ